MAIISPAAAAHSFKRHLPGDAPAGFVSARPDLSPAKKSRVSAAEESQDALDSEWLRSILAEDAPAAPSSAPTRGGTSTALPDAHLWLWLETGVCYRPKEGGNSLGEDAHFINKAGRGFGVADGVGGWSRRGVDAGVFARQLMSQCAAKIEEYSRYGSPGIFLHEVLKLALAGTTARGTSTACIWAVDGNLLRGAGIGDSGVVVVRDGAVVFQSPRNQKRYNHPYQIGRASPGDSVDDAKTFTVQLSPGDTVVAGTDGLFDNLFDEEIAAVVTLLRREGAADEIARALAAAAVDAFRTAHDTPFAVAGRAAGIPHTGGKSDDVTVVVTKVDGDEDDESSGTTDQEEERWIREWINDLCSN